MLNQSPPPSLRALTITQVLSDLTVGDEKLENLFLKEKQSAALQIALTDYLEFK